MFNSTDIWAFTGVLIATTLENVIRAAKVVNKFKLIYLYNGEEKNLLMLMDIMNVVPVFVTNSQDSDEIYRLTGKKPTNISKLSIKNILGVI